MAGNQTSKGSVLLVSVFAAFITPFMSSAVNLALPAIGKDLHAIAIQQGWVISSFLLASAIFLIPFGKLADIVGRKKIFSLGLLLFAVSTSFIVFSCSIISLIILRVAQGIACSMIFGTSLAIITSVFGPGERGRAMGINITSIMSSVEKRHLGIASGVVGTMRIVGQMMSMGIAMMLISLYIGKQSINPGTYPGLTSAMRTGFVVFSALSVLGIFASLARNKKSGSI